MKTHRFRQYILWFLGTAAAGLLLLVLCACLPQGPIDAHVRDAAEALGNEGCYPAIFDRAASAGLDNYTDAIMMDVSRGTNRADLSTVLTNPVHHGEKDPVASLADYAARPADSPAAFFYPRYWMGFRVLTRTALVFFNYLQIRRYLGFSLLLLVLLTTLAVAREAGRRAAFFFGLSLLLVRPQVICQSLQLSCCFFLALFGMLLIPWVRKRPEREGIFFLEMGILTMYFDFYTAPILSYGLPMVYLCLLAAREGKRLSWKRILGSLGVWLAGYALMWLAKLTLTTLLTPENAFESGFSTFRMWVLGAGEGTRVTPWQALNAVRHALTADTPGAVVWGLGLGCFLVFLLWRTLRKRTDPEALRRHGELLLLALVPLLWFSVAAKPSTVHAWFQYRSVAMSFWALGAWLSLYLAPPEERLAAR